jgi:hypothetical protein
MFRFVLVPLFVLAAIAAQDPVATEPKAFPNATCPIMGKKVSLPLFIDTELGRIWVCCKPCFKKVLANVAAAHKTAYPVVADIDNKQCPVSGEPIGELAVAVTLQGSRFHVCCAGCVDGARAHSQLVLQKLAQPELIDVGNATCPVKGEPAAPQAFAIIAGHIVHLSSPKLLEQVNKDAGAILQKAKELAAAQPPKPQHEHQSKPAAAAPPAAPPEPKK